jgi:hypothetical protein
MSTEITTVTPSELAAILTLAIRERMPIMISGKPGVGKSKIVEQAVAAAKADLVLKHPVVDDPTDYKGMPWVDKGVASFLPFGDLNLLINAKKPTVAFFDDLGQASNSVQAASMQLFLARRINGHKVSDFVTFIAATNRRADRAGVQGILEPLKSRFDGLFELEVDIDDWCTWALNNGLPHEMVAFIRFRPALLSDFKATADMTNSPSPRGWESVARWYKLGMPSRLQVVCYEGAVGKGAAGEWLAFSRVWQQMVSPDLILTNPDTAPIPKGEPSALYAVAGALAQRVQPASMGRYMTYLERVFDEGEPEPCAASIKMALARDPKLANTQGYIKGMSGALGQLMIG